MKCYMTGKVCDFYQETVENREIFIVSPFGFPYDAMYAGDEESRGDKTDGDAGGEIWQRLQEVGMLPHRSDSAMRLGSIMCQGICKEIIEKQFLLADISRPNANVYYELGLACALRRDLLVCVNANAKNRHLGLLQGIREEADSAWLSYTTVDTLREKLTPKLFNTNATYRLKDSIPAEQVAKLILVIENGESDTSGVYAHVLERALCNMTFDAVLKKGFVKVDQDSFREDDWRLRADSKDGWLTKTIRVGNPPDGDQSDVPGDVLLVHDLETLTREMLQAKVCVVDTTRYPTAAAPLGTPYMYFCLGMAHGLEKEAIPITNTEDVASTPFDVKGLWHIFFSDEPELRNGFAKIMPRISVDFHQEKQDHPYRKVWDGFLGTNQDLSIIYCGRPIDDKGQLRTGRTNIDSWDTKAVTEASFYLAQKYPTAVIKPAPPQTKEPGKRSRELVDGIRTEFRNAYRNCIIVGSPDVNDYAEVALAQIFGVPPFKRRTKRELRKLTVDGLVFLKTNLGKTIHSAFSISSPEDTNSVRIGGRREPCYEPKDAEDKATGSTYGVLTISPNPFLRPGEGRIMVLSGFTGLATCGLMLLLVDSDTDDYNPVRNAFDKLLREGIAKMYPGPEETRAFSVLVRFDYTEKATPHEGGTTARGDHRAFAGVALAGRRILTDVTPKLD